MKIKITYCGDWDYYPMASRAEKEVLEFFKNAEVELIESGRGIFQITLNDKLVFDKYTLGRFPEKGEMKEILILR